jgi:hypothetical protein
MSFGIPVRNGLGIGLTSSTSLSSGARGVIRPALFLDFIGTTSLDSRVTFSRGSNATLVDSTGKITYAPANLLTFSEQFDNAAWGKVATTVTANTTVAPDGTSTADKIVATATTGFHDIRQFVTGTVASYTLSVYAKAAEYSKIVLANASAGTWSATFDLATGATIATGGAAVLSSSIQSVGNGWYRCAVTFTGAASSVAHTAVGYPNTGATLNNFGAQYTGDGTSGIFLWGAQVEPVTYQTTPSTYVATTTAAYYGPRFDYDPVTLAAKGLLIEEARTNLLLRSEEFDNASWGKAQVTVTANATISPDGTIDADLVVPTAAAGNHQVTQSVTTTAVAHGFSLYAKASGYNWIALALTDSASAIQTTYFNISTGIVGSVGAGVTASVTPVGNGWYRCTVVLSAALAGANTMRAYVATANNINSFTGNGTSGLFVWGAQLEAGAFATSYIPTVASQVTRSADVATMTGTNFSSWYNQSEGTFVEDFSFFASADTVNSKAFFAVSDGTTNNRIYGNLNSLSVPFVFIAAGGVTQANISTIVAVTNNAVAKVASGYKLNDFAAVLNGGAVTTDTSGTVPTVDRLGIGNLNNFSQINGHIRQIAYYNTRLPNATLQTLTETPGAYSASYLAVAGGASGGSNDTNMGTGGGGAGGLLSGTSTIVAGTVYTVAVGAGAAVQSGNGNGINGSNSSALGVTATGGGAGSGVGSGNGVAGGSGGGGSGTFGFAITSGGAGTSGQGRNGGGGQDSGVDADAQVGGGGGGASAVGSAGTGTSGGNGGAGTASSITGSSVTYAGGGGGGKRIAGTAGTGGAGGGGAGGAAANGTAGTANLGGGGGGAGTGGGGTVRTGGAGGSGVVILSVPTAKYTGTTTGSPTVTTSGANTIMTFTSSGSYTA